MTELFSPPHARALDGDVDDKKSGSGTSVLVIDIGAHGGAALIGWAGLWRERAGR